MPGKQDVVTIWDENGDKHKEQRSIKFVNENPDITIGKSKFAELRPKEVLSSKMSHNVCGCIYHENMILLLQELYHIVPDLLPLYGKEFIASCVREIYSKKCMSSNCALCKNKFKSVFIDEVMMMPFFEKIQHGISGREMKMMVRLKNWRKREMFINF